MARHPAPLERKRRIGRRRNYDSGGRPLPDIKAVAVLPMADGVPEPPEQFLLEGTKLWERIWSTGAAWISPATDLHAVLLACRLEDAMAVAYQRYLVTGDKDDARIVKIFVEQQMSILSKLGFTPSDRARLGVAAVKAKSALEELRDRQRGQRGPT